MLITLDIDEKHLDNGNNFEVKKNKDGNIVVLEVTKKIVQRIDK